MNFNIGSKLGVLLQLNKTQETLSKSFERLSSGKRINSAADDAAGLAIADALQADKVTLDQGSRNAGDAISAAQIADGALSQVSEIDTRIRELSTQAANGTVSDEQRASLNQEAQQLVQERDRIIETTEFNGRKLLNSSSDISVQVGSDSGENSAISFGTLDVSSTLGSVDISTQAGAQAALDATETSIASISSKRGELGAVTQRLNTAISNNEVAAENLAAAEAQIRDVDIAAELATKVSSEIRSNVGVAVAAQANQSSKSVLDLLK